MLKKLGLIALSSLLVLPAISSADTPELAFNLALYDSDGNGYQSDEVTLKGDYYLYVHTFVCPVSAGYECSVSFYQGGTKKCAIASLGGSPEIEVNTCNYLPAGTYDIYGQGYDPIFIDGYLEELPTVGGGVEVPDDQINFEYFGSTLQGLVGDLVSGLGNVMPVLMIIGLPILVLFVFIQVLAHMASNIGTPGKVYGVQKKSDEELQQEDLYYQEVMGYNTDIDNDDYFNMYKNRRSDFIEKHDVNKIVENTVDHTDEYRAKIKEFYDEEYQYSLDQWKKDFHSGNRIRMSWVDGRSDEANYQRTIDHRVGDRLREYFDKKYGEGYGEKAVQLRNEDDRSGLTHYSKY